jgi:hypothetical protein
MLGEVLFPVAASFFFATFFFAASFSANPFPATFFFFAIVRFSGASSSQPTPRQSGDIGLSIASWQEESRTMPVLRPSSQ